MKYMHAILKYKKCSVIQQKRHVHVMLLHHYTKPLLLTTKYKINIYFLLKYIYIYFFLYFYYAEKREEKNDYNRDGRSEREERENRVSTFRNQSGTNFHQTTLTHQTEAGQMGSRPAVPKPLTLSTTNASGDECGETHSQHC